MGTSVAFKNMHQYFFLRCFMKVFICLYFDCWCFGWQNGKSPSESRMLLKIYILLYWFWKLKTLKWRVNFEIFLLKNRLSLGIVFKDRPYRVIWSYRVYKQGISGKIFRFSMIIWNTEQLGLKLNIILKSYDDCKIY